MKFWNQVSLLRLLLPFMAGILSSVYLQLSIDYTLWLLSALFLCFFLLSKSKKSGFVFRFRWLTGLLAAVLLFICGMQLIYWKTEKNFNQHYARFLDSTNCVLAEIREAPTDKGKSFKTETSIVSIYSKGHWQSCLGKAMLSIASDSASAVLKYGDLILADVILKPVPEPQNPAEFNYHRYLQFHNINYQAYLKPGHWKNLHGSRGNPIYNFCLSIRDYLLAVFRENGIQGDEFAVGAALILGYEDKLNPDIMSAYSASGALHVLSVSGLHLAIVFVVLDFLLKFFEKFKNGALIKAVLLIFLLWVYAALTGLSPSVLRSAAMFTLIIIGRSLKRYTNIYNTLAASMFALLIWDPYLLMEVGFQLSYLAVLGIVSLQARIQTLWNVKNKILNQIWTITSVSIAAQIATFPLGLFYFHQFPNYFLISNLVVIPVSTVILYLGVGVCMLSKIKIVAFLLCKLLAGLIWFLNSSVSFFEALPYSVIQGVSISVIEVWLIYALLSAVFLFLSFRNIRFLTCSFLISIILVSVFIARNYAQMTQRKLIVYNIKNHSALEFVEGRKNYFFSDTALLKNKYSLLFHVKHNWWDMGIDCNTMEGRSNLYDGYAHHYLICKNNLIAFEGKRILCINQLNAGSTRELSLTDSVDFIVVSDNPKIKMDYLVGKLKFRKLIFDSSNSANKIKYWTKQCKAHNIAFYDVNTQGAFIENL